MRANRTGAHTHRINREGQTDRLASNHSSKVGCIFSGLFFSCVKASSVECTPYGSIQASLKPGKQNSLQSTAEQRPREAEGPGTQRAREAEGPGKGSLVSFPPTALPRVELRATQQKGQHHLRGKLRSWEGGPESVGLSQERMSSGRTPHVPGFPESHM